MHTLELWHLQRLCDQHGLDHQLIDLTLTYSENKKYLLSLVPQVSLEDDLDEWKSQEEYYMKHRFLTFYITCLREGMTKSKEMGIPISTGFSLKEWVSTTKTIK